MGNFTEYLANHVDQFRKHPASGLVFCLEEYEKDFSVLDSQDFRETVRFAIDNVGFTRGDLTAAYGVDERTLNRWKTGVDIPNSARRTHIIFDIYVRAKTKIENET